jgi:predicted transposase/invertase (TIGR01784 family)
MMGCEYMRDEMNQILTQEEIQEIESFGITLNSDLLDPKVDIVFKAMLTSQSSESKKALIHFLSAILQRNIKKVIVLNNELANTGVFQKQSIFDIHVGFDEDDEADIEMQMVLSDNMINRSEYNTAKLFSSQNIKGKPYTALKKVYSVIIMNFTLFVGQPKFFDEYMYRNPEGKILSGNTKIIYIELTKLDEVEKKAVSEMTKIEKWALFLKYVNQKGKQDLIQSIINSEEGIRMGAEVLETISKDREEFSRYFHYLKAEIDRESQLIYAHQQGMEKGMQQGMEKGKTEAAISIIKEFRATVSRAMEITKLPEEKRDELIRDLENQQIPYTLQ